MITTDRDVFVGAHLTNDNKERLRAEAARRKMSMSALISTILEEWLVVAPDEQLEPIRSNRRGPQEIDVPLPLES